MTRLLLFAVFAMASTKASKDTTYYPGGITNPAVDQPLYWHDAHEVLSDLDQFQSLYVTFHSCVWSELVVDADNNDDDGDEDETDTWYLGSVPHFRANVAYSLYGVLEGEDNTGCNRATYINSFFTRGGVTSFTNAMAYAGMDSFIAVDGDDNGDNQNAGTITSACYGLEEEGGGNNGNGGYYNGEKIDQRSQSYGLGCTADLDFAMFTYQGQYCDGNAILDMTDELESFNENIQDVSCIQIYNRSTAYYYYNNDGEFDEENGSPLAVLAASKACNVRDLTTTCPDPYHKLKYYAHQLESALASVERPPFFIQKRMDVITWSFYSIGGALAIAAIFVVVFVCCEKKRASNYKGSRFGSALMDTSSRSMTNSMRKASKKSKRKKSSNVMKDFLKNDKKKKNATLRKKRSGASGAVAGGGAAAAAAAAAAVPVAVAGGDTSNANDRRDGDGDGDNGGGTSGDNNGGDKGGNDVRGDNHGDNRDDDNGSIIDDDDSTASNVSVDGEEGDEENGGLTNAQVAIPQYTRKIETANASPKKRKKWVWFIKLRKGKKNNGS